MYVLYERIQTLYTTFERAQFAQYPSKRRKMISMIQIIMLRRVLSKVHTRILQETMNKKTPQKLPEVKLYKSTRDKLPYLPSCTDAASFCTSSLPSSVRTNVLSWHTYPDRNHTQNWRTFCFRTSDVRRPNQPTDRPRFLGSTKARHQHRSNPSPFIPVVIIELPTHSSPLLYPLLVAVDRLVFFFSSSSSFFFFPRGLS